MRPKKEGVERKEGGGGGRSGECEKWLVEMCGLG